MRVLMTTDTVGGVWTFTKELSSGLLESGCAVALVSLGRRPSHAQQVMGGCGERRGGERGFAMSALDAPLEWMTENGRAFSEAAPVSSQGCGRFSAELLLTSQYCFGALECDIPRAVVAHSDVLSWATGVPACRA